MVMYKKPGLYTAIIIASFAYSVRADVVYETSFEQYQAGLFNELSAENACWKTISGKAQIKTDAKKGSQCLHLLGGKNTSVELNLLNDSDIYRVSFWAERWTRRNPFSFRVMAHQSGRWIVVYNGDKTIRVGRKFLSFVSFNLNKQKTDKLLFSCSSPSKTGIMIDDLRIERASQMKIKFVTAKQTVAPALIGKAGNPILRLQVEVTGNLNPLSVNSLHIDTSGTDDLDDIDQVEVFYTGNEEFFQMDKPFGVSKQPSNRIIFSGDAQLIPGQNNFWVSYRLKSTADLLNSVDAACLQIQVNGDSSQAVRPEPNSSIICKRIGHALRDGRDDGVNVYRIPGLATTNNGTLIGVYDVRYRGWSDLPGDIDVGMSRSTDKGQSWQPMKIIMDMGTPHEQNGIGDPSILIDRKNGNIWVAALWSKGDNAWHGSGPGLTPDQTGQLMLVKSTDDGLTWSKPMNITAQVKDPKWRLLLQGPGKGINMRNGTLVFPAQFKDDKNIPHSTIIYSTNHGRTWQVGTGAESDTTEAQVVELNDGSLMLNMRDNRGGSRSVYITMDMGKTWNAHPSSRGALPEPVCMASLIRFSSKKECQAENILLFSNPAVSRAPRRSITIKASIDEGMSWPQKFHKLIHEPQCAGYSCLTKIDDSTFGILYEGGKTAHLVFEKFSIDDILRNQNPAGK